jgi:hypothetical protein
MVSVGLDPPAHDAGWVKPDQLGVEARVLLVPTFFYNLSPTAHLDPASSPRRQHLVHHERRPPGTPRVAELLTGCQVVAANIYSVELML